MALQCLKSVITEWQWWIMSNNIRCAGTLSPDWWVLSRPKTVFAAVWQTGDWWRKEANIDWGAAGHFCSTRWHRESCLMQIYLKVKKLSFLWKRLHPLWIWTFFACARMCEWRPVWPQCSAVQCNAEQPLRRWNTLKVTHQGVLAVEWGLSISVWHVVSQIMHNLFDTFPLRQSIMPLS